ncbi:MAG TPA: hypothetical protein VGO89_22620 [Streptomyces sp.]|jgi:hypothetical protein|nr:hypothetical protein [Streptomyces sp.]
MYDQLPQVHADRTQRRDEGSSPRGALSRHSRKLALPVLAAASAVLLLGGCSGEGDTAAAASGKPPTVEKLAAALDCKSKITRGKVEDYRQGVCKIDKQLYTLVTFKDNKAKRDWLEFSKSYGGTYLVGSRWIIVGEPPSKLATVQGKYGGSIEEGDKHH